MTFKKVSTKKQTSEKFSTFGSCLMGEKGRMNEIQKERKKEENVLLDEISL